MRAAFASPECPPGCMLRLSPGRYRESKWLLPGEKNARKSLTCHYNADLKLFAKFMLNGYPEKINRSKETSKLCSGRITQSGIYPKLQRGSVHVKIIASYYLLSNPNPSMHSRKLSEIDFLVCIVLKKQFHCLQSVLSGEWRIRNIWNMCI